MLAVGAENVLAELHRTPTAGVLPQCVPSEREGGYCANDAPISATKPDSCTLHQSDFRSNGIILQITAMSFQEMREETSRLFEESVMLAPSPNFRCTYI